MLKINTPKVWGTLAALVAAVAATTLVTEGGYSNDPNDSGGETNHGVTIAVARQNGYTGDMRNMTEADAKAIYENQYIKRPGFDKVLAVSPAVGSKVIDYGVNAGPGTAARAMQQAISDLSRGGRDYAVPAVDGVVGNGTMRAYRALEAKRGRVKTCELMLKLLDASQANLYVSLARKSHANASFIVGWVDNRVGNISSSRCDERV